MRLVEAWPAAAALRRLASAREAVTAASCSVGFCTGGGMAGIEGDEKHKGDLEKGRPRECPPPGPGGLLDGETARIARRVRLGEHCSRENIDVHADGGSCPAKRHISPDELGDQARRKRDHNP